MKILLVSADKALRSQWHQALSRHSLVVDIATDGEEAWGLLQTFMHDIVLIEFALPEMDGLTLCRRLREVGNPVLLLLMVESNDSGTSIQSLDNGADACLAKPIRESELITHIRALSCRGGHRASPNLSWGPLLLNPTACRIG